MTWIDDSSDFTSKLSKAIEEYLELVKKQASNASSNTNNQEDSILLEKPKTSLPNYLDEGLSKAETLVDLEHNGELSSSKIIDIGPISIIRSIAAINPVAAHLVLENVKLAYKLHTIIGEPFVNTQSESLKQQTPNDRVEKLQYLAHISKLEIEKALSSSPQFHETLGSNANQDELNNILATKQSVINDQAKHILKCELENHRFSETVKEYEAHFSSIADVFGAVYETKEELVAHIGKKISEKDEAIQNSEAEIQVFFNGSNVGVTSIVLITN